MNRSSLRLLACAALLAALAGAALGAAPAAPAKGNPADGKKIFAAKACATCHKPDGSGGFKAVPTGNPTPNWKDPKTWADPKRTDAYLRDCITNGKPQSGMVAWGKSGQVKPADIDNLIAYIHTFSAGKPAAPAAAKPKGK